MISSSNKKILDLLQQNCKLSTREISHRLKMPMTTVHNRIKKMEREGIIKGYTAIVDNKRLGKNVRAIIQISAIYSGPAGKSLSHQKIAEQLYRMPEVESCFITTGKADVCLHVLVKDLDDLNNFVSNKLRTTPGVEGVTTSVVLMDLTEKFGKKNTETGDTLISQKTYKLEKGMEFVS